MFLVGDVQVRANKPLTPDLGQSRSISGDNTNPPVCTSLGRDYAIFGLVVFLRSQRPPPGNISLNALSVFRVKRRDPILVRVVDGGWRKAMKVKISGRKR